MSTRRLNAKRKDSKGSSSSDAQNNGITALHNIDRRRSNDAAVDDTAGGDSDQQRDISLLEAELEKVNLELTTVRNERDKQRKQLSTLEAENDQLTHQKEQRIKRSQLQNQLQDLERSVRKKTNKKLRAVEDLEQSKSRHRQLGKTMELMEKGAQSILAKSYYYDHHKATNNTKEGKLRTQNRQEVLKGLLAKKEDLKMKLLTSSVSSTRLSFGGGDASRSHRSNMMMNIARAEDEDDDINDQDEVDRQPIASLFDKNKRTDSINSEISDNDYLEQAAQTYRVPSAAASEGHSNNNRSSRSRSRSRKRSTSNDRDRSNSRDRSTRSNSNKSNSNRNNKSQSGRRGGKRPGNKSSSKEEADEGGDETINHSTSATSSKISGLASMIESTRGGSGDDDSDDTPKTANTNG